MRRRVEESADVGGQPLMAATIGMKRVLHSSPWTQLASRNMLRALSALALTAIPTALVGCAESQGQDAPTVTMRPTEARDRSLALQREIIEMIPAEDREDNFLPGVDGEPRKLYFCKPILSEEYYQDSGTDVEAVQYPGRVFVAVDRDASVDTIVLNINERLSQRDGWTSERRGTIDPEDPPYIYSPDGYQIAVRSDPVPDTDIDSVQIVVWSPCFIPEGGTLPPGRKI